MNHIVMQQEKARQRTGTITPRYAVLAKREKGQLGRETDKLVVYDLLDRNVVDTFQGQDKRQADHICFLLNHGMAYKTIDDVNREMTEAFARGE